MTKRTVLLVEDDEDLRAVASELLLEEGFAVQISASGHEVLSLLRGGLRPGCILLDLGLPDMSADDFLSEFNAIPGAAEMPVVLVSGNADLGDWAKRFKAGRVIRKPYGVDCLVDAVSELCGERVLAAAGPVS